MSFAGLYGKHSLTASRANLRFDQLGHEATWKPSGFPTLRKAQNKTQEAKDNVVRRVCGRLSLSGEGSIHGIDGSRISKLWMSRDGRTVANYDRGWDIHPNAEAQAAFEKIIARFS